MSLLSKIKQLRKPKIEEATDMSQKETEADKVTMSQEEVEQALEGLTTASEESSKKLAKHSLRLAKMEQTPSIPEALDDRVSAMEDKIEELGAATMEQATPATLDSSKFFARVMDEFVVPDVLQRAQAAGVISFNQDHQKEGEEEEGEEGAEGEDVAAEQGEEAENVDQENADFDPAKPFLEYDSKPFTGATFSKKHSRYERVVIPEGFKFS